MAKKKKNILTKAQKAVLKKINYNVAGIDLSSEDMYIIILPEN